MLAGSQSSLCVFDFYGFVYLGEVLVVFKEVTILIFDVDLFVFYLRFQEVEIAAEDLVGALAELAEV